METRASYLIVGSFVLVLLVAAVAFVIWLAKVPSTHETKVYHIDFRDPVTGLERGARVLYRGIPVGSVTGIRIDPESVEEIQVIIEVDADTPIKEDTVASLGFQGLTFVAYVQLEGGTQGAPPLMPKPDRKIATIPSRASPLQQVFNSAPELLDHVNRLIERADKALSEQNIAALSQSIENVRTLTAALADKSRTIETLIDDSSVMMHDLRSTVASLDALTKNLNGESKDLSAELKPTIKQFRLAAQSIDGLATEVQAVVSENRGALKDFSGQGLYELTKFLADARVMVQALTRLSNKLEADPARFFLGNQQQGVPAR